MRRIASRRPSPALVLSGVALFVALSGTAVALKANSVASRHIQEGAVKSVHIKDSKGVKGADVVDESLGGADLATNAIPADGIGQEGSSKVAVGAIDRHELAIGAVGAIELGDVVLRPGSPTAITDADGGDENWSGGTASATCLGLQQLLSAYGEWTDGSGGDDTAIAEMVLNPDSGGVIVRGIQNTGDTRSVRAVAVCLDYIP
jgi:hypothetical protein